MSTSTLSNELDLVSNELDADLEDYDGVNNFCFYARTKWQNVDTFMKC